MNSVTVVDLVHCRIALPHHCIAGIENISDARPDESAQRSYWQLQRGQRRWPLYALDEDLQMLALVPPAHRLALCFKQPDIALSCAKIETLDNPPITPLPLMMQKAGGMVTGLILNKGNVVLHINTEALFARLTEDQRFVPPSTSQESQKWNAQPGI